MLSQRPFKDTDEVYAAAERIWWDLAPEDWHEAFRAHPRIGESDSREQAGMRSASSEMRAKIADANRAYEAKFGWIYLVCATGKSPEEMLALCRARMNNAPDVELKVAAGEQAKITRLRLEKVMTL